jgi:hypothetical protein
MKRTTAKEMMNLLEEVSGESRDNTFEFVRIRADKSTMKDVALIINQMMTGSEQVSTPEVTPEDSVTPDYSYSPADRSEFVSGNPIRKLNFDDVCRCFSCGYELKRNVIGLPCRSISCPKCGAAMCEITPVKSGDRAKLLDPRRMPLGAGDDY